jgi:hypothetical protein
LTRFRLIWFVLLALAQPAAAWATPGFFVGGGEDRIRTLTQAVPVARDLGIGAYRVSLEWDGTQTTLSAQQRQELDVLARTAPASMRLVPTLWQLGAATPLDADGRERFCAFARDVVTSYPRIRDVIVGNEPNKTDFWRRQFNEDETSAAPAAYVALLARCYDVLHAARPTVNVIGAATSPRGNDRPNAVSNISHSPVAFIQRMGEAYRASGRQARIFDTVAHHAYGSQPHERPWRAHGGTQISQGDWSKLMGAYVHGFEGTTQPIPGECTAGRCVWIWFTEAGYQTMPDEAKASLYSGTENFVPVPDYVGGEPESPPPAVTTPAPDQWTQLRDGIRLAACQPYVQAFFNYMIADSPYLNQWQSGLLWADWTPKDSYPAFKAATAEATSGRVPCNALKSGPPTVADSNAPAAPSRPKARLRGTRLSLDWPDAADDDVMGYAVFRAPKARGPFRRLNRTGLTSNSVWVDRGLRRGRTYCYAVVAFDTVENRSRRSAARCVTVRRR